MKSLPFLLISVFVLSTFSFGQIKPDKVLVTIKNHKVTAGEFERVYQKNSQVGTSEKETVENYFDLYVKFKLKVIAAIDSGYDKQPSFINELKGYKDQLARNYLTDSIALNNLVKEAYERTLTEINSSHIMVMLQANPSPKDTLEAWNKIIKIKERIDKGESFEQVANETSEDPSAKTNNGALGYFSCFQLPYSFETGTYNTPVGTVSNPIRTRFGYHLIKVNGKRPAKGEVRVAHIMVRTPESFTDEQKKLAEQKINDIYNRIQKGEVFDTLARKISEDEYSAQNNGELPWFSTRMMVPEFEDAAFNLKVIGEISKPVKTQFGWHIIKLLETKPLASFEKMQNDLKAKITQNDRNEMVQKSFVSRLKREYKPVINKQAIESLYKLDSLILKSDTNLALFCDTNKVFLTINKKAYPVKTFLKEVKTMRDAFLKWSAKDYLDQLIPIYTDKMLVEYETNNLENKYPDYANLSQEYFEGILLFDIMEKTIWSKASTDSVGLEAYFAKNKEKYNDPEPKPLEEIKGIVISDYQNYLEENWIAELRKRYPVVTDQKLLDKIAQKYNSTANAK